MSEFRRMHLEPVLKSRCLLAALSVLLLFSAGCAKSRAVASADSVVGQQARESEDTPTLGEYIRSVFRLSQQGSAAPDSEVANLHSAKPELAELAVQIEREPANVEARRALAAAYLEEGLLTEAYRLLEEVRAVGTRSVAVEIGLAEIWDEWGNFPRAHQHATRAVEIEADNAEAWEVLGRVQMHRGDFESAASAFGKALAIGDGEDAYLLANLGYVHFKMGEWAQARPYFESALKLDDSLVEVHNNLGITLARLYEDELALEHFKAVADEEVAYNNLGVVQMERGDWVAAHAAFKQALSIEPEYAKAAFNLVEAESFLPAPAVIDVGNFGTPSVTVATVAAAPREASLVQLAALPASGNVNLPNWPRTFSPIASPEISVATSRSLLASLAADEPTRLPVRESWLPAAPDVAPPAQTTAPAATGRQQVQVAESVVEAAPEVTAEPEQAPAPRRIATNRTRAPQPEQTATPTPESRIERPTPVAAVTEEAKPAATPRRATPERRADRAPSSVASEPVAGEPQAAAEDVEEPEAVLPEADEEAAAEPEIAAVASDSSVPPADTGSTGGRLVALLAIVGLGAAAGSLTAGRFWGLVGGLVGALAAAFTTLLRG